MIEVKNLSKSFSGKSVLRNFNLQVKRGQRIALLGLSGSGKTTALKLLCGLHLPDTGSIRVNELHVDPSNLPLLRKKIGYVIQDGGLFPHLTALENILLVAQEANHSSSETETRITELCQLTKISNDLLTRYPRQLSGGQRQRIGIMRALFLDPEILLLDEPMGALDPITRRQLQLELKELFSRLEKTVVLVTHDLNEAMFLADRIVLLNYGAIVQEGAMEDLLLRPADAFVELFVSAQKNHLSSQL
jgi:osmoprotectant transport system ATP-binding protein